MSQAGLAEDLYAGKRLSTESWADAALALLRILRPSDGWISLSLLALNLIIVVWSVVHAEWVDTPNLVGVLLLGMLTGLALYRLPVWGILVFPIGLAVGLLTVVWQMTSFMGGEDTVTDAGQLWDRLELWFSAVKSGNINIDQVPFAFGILAASWLCGYVAVWVFGRYRNFWGVFILGAAGLLSNLTYLPPNASVFLGMYLFTALLLIARIQAVRRRQNWIRRNIRYDGHLGALSLSDSFFLAAAVLTVAFLIPVGKTVGPMHDVYEYIRSPLDTWEDDFNRLFAGLPARRPLGYRIWGDVMAFQGTIYPTTVEVLRVESQAPIYWKARSYGTYTAKGWVSEETTWEPLDWVPSYAESQPAKSRLEVTYSVKPNYATKIVFAGDRILAADRPVWVETYDSPQYRINLATAEAGQGLPPALADTAGRLSQIVNQRGALVDDSSLAAVMPSGQRLLEVHRSGNMNGIVTGVTVVETLPIRPDVLAVRSPEGKIKAGEKYQITSSVSVASPRELRTAGTRYPAWAVMKYTQLPEDLPRRVRDLGAQLTAESETPYDKAKAIEAYLAQFPYKLQVSPPPFNADGVDHFLFTLGQGYSEYFASAMAVLLRSVGVPTRLATGYTQGDKLPGEDIYLVTDSHSHAWVEVYFPGYGWVSFEPTPGGEIPNPSLAAREGEPKTQTSDEESEPAGLECFVEVIECDEEDAPASGLDLDAGGSSGKLIAVLPWLAAVLAGVAILGGGGVYLWRRYMSPTDDPQTAYHRMSLLGKLGSLGPMAHQTPYQYRERLRNALPNHREEVTTLVDSYVLSQYGAKRLAVGDRNRIANAWMRVRLPMLRRIFTLRPRDIRGDGRINIWKA